MLALNEWARGLEIDEEDEAFAAARQTATLARHAQGKAAWNDWARAMLALKTDLGAAGGRAPDRPREGENADTRYWLALATATFSTSAGRHKFEGTANFYELVFAGPTHFEHAIFAAATVFERATFAADASFRDATFADASFNDATFAANAWFTGANFAANASFAGVTFAAAWFGGATFEFASFEDVTFADAFFGGATFAADARFGGATFAGPTVMNGVTFDGAVDLAQAKFRGPVHLNGSVFQGAARFEAIDSEAAFSLADATFHQVPNLIGATFKGTLRLDNVTTPRYRATFGWTPDKDASAHFRELKRWAEEARDRDRELEFFAQEIRTGRFHASALVPTWKREATPQGAAQRRVWLGMLLPRWMRVALPTWVPKVWSWRFWFGLAYGGFSNFGRSLWRPALAWLALLLGFAVFYLGQHEGQHLARKAMKPDGGWARVHAYVATARAAWANPPKCIAPGDRSSSDKLVASTNVVNEALLLSASNALVVFNIGRGDVSRRTYGCLYGFEQGGLQAPTIVPYRVAVASTLQTLASAVLIFLFLLAVRNLLRLK